MDQLERNGELSDPRAPTPTGTVGGDAQHWSDSFPFRESPVVDGAREFDRKEVTGIRYRRAQSLFDPRCLRT